MLTKQKFFVSSTHIKKIQSKNFIGLIIMFLSDTFYYSLTANTEQESKIGCLVKLKMF